MWIWVDVFLAGIEPGTCGHLNLLSPALFTTELRWRMNHRKSLRILSKTIDQMRHRQDSLRNKMRCRQHSSIVFLPQARISNWILSGSLFCWCSMYSFFTFHISESYWFNQLVINEIFIELIQANILRICLLHWVNTMIKQFELPAKLLDYFLWSYKSNITETQ